MHTKINRNIHTKLLTNNDWKNHLFKKRTMESGNLPSFPAMRPSQSTFVYAVTNKRTISCKMLKHNIKVYVHYAE